MKMTIDYSNDNFTREDLNEKKNKFLKENVGITLEEARKERFYYKGKALISPQLLLIENYNEETKKMIISLEKVEIMEECVFIVFQHQFVCGNYGDLEDCKSLLHGVYGDINLALEATKYIEETSFKTQFGTVDCSWYIEIAPINTKLI